MVYSNLIERCKICCRKKWILQLFTNVSDFVELLALKTEGILYLNEMYLKKNFDGTKIINIKIIILFANYGLNTLGCTLMCRYNKVTWLEAITQCDHVHPPPPTNITTHHQAHVQHYPLLANPPQY